MPKDTKRVRRSPAQWQRLIAEQAESGLGQVAFCRAHGLAPSSFCHWKRKLSVWPPASDDVAMADFVELTRDPVAACNSGWDVELDLGAGMVLRLRRR